MDKNNNQNGWPIWANESVEIVTANPDWQDQGRHEEQHLYDLLNPYGISEVIHIGSTSIPGLPAKPIIDLMAETDSFDRVEDISTKLAEYDWHYVSPELDERPWRRFFVKVKNNKRVAHLHLMVKGNERWEQQLLFRNRLRENLQLVCEYSTLKQGLAKRFNQDRESYTKAKTEFIKQVLNN
ncbi:GrpB family protein [Lysinibacillus sp. UGB7]|uniref:GrpB family protein n=1 Tax=Lysinibacillus sp. UGB7 TaxID=3411039 RepID=UPI003B804AE0